MRVLLTGSSGWLGRHLAPLLASRGHDVTGLDVAPGAHTRVLGSVANRSLVFQTVAHYGIEAVIHAGALHKPDIVRFPRQAFIDTNVTGTLNLLEAAALEGHARFLFTSTTSLMVRADVRAGAGDKGAWWMDEAFGPLEPRNIYGATKLAAENLCRVVSQGSGMAAAIFAGLRGAIVTVLDTRDDRLDFCRKHLNVHAAVKIGEGDKEALADLTEGDFYDVVFDATGNARAMERGFEFIAHGGTYVMISVVRDSITFSDPEFHKREATLMGSRNATVEDFRYVEQCLRDGLIPDQALNTHRIPLSEVVNQFTTLLDPQQGVVKAIIEC